MIVTCSNNEVALGGVDSFPEQRRLVIEPMDTSEKYLPYVFTVIGIYRNTFTYSLSLFQWFSNHQLASSKLLFVLVMSSDWYN